METMIGITLVSAMFLDTLRSEIIKGASVTREKRSTPKSVRGGARAGAGRPRTADADRAILAACLDRLEKVGYGPLTIDDVAAAAGVAKTTVYRRWPSK